MLDCAIADRCGACAWIDRPQASQLDGKRERVVRVLRDQGISSEVASCYPSPLEGSYRNRAKLAVREAAIGLFERGSERIVDLSGCPVQRPELLSALARIRPWLTEHELAAPAGPVKYLDLRAGVDETIHLTLVMHTERELPVEPLRKALPELCGLSINLNPFDSSYPFGEKTRTLWGRRSFEIALPDGDRFEVPATGFFQLSTELLPEVHRRMRAHLACDGEGWLLDLYCGVGTHALTLARDFAGILGIEQATPAISCARRNADRRQLRHRFVAERLSAEALARLRLTAGDPKIDAVILNPGRAGADGATLDALPADVPIAYLSCDPETLARDLKRLGRPIVAVEPFDFLPQTDHVEVLALLSRARSSSHGT